MGKFAIECPKCGSLNKASTFILAKKIIKCGNCGNEIKVKEARMSAKTCPHCGKTYVYDQAKEDKTVKCPYCGGDFNALLADRTKESRLVGLLCPQCACSIEVDSSLDHFDCPVCDYRIDVKKTIAKKNQVKDNAVSVIKYEGDNTTFVWKHPLEDFNTGSQLIVHESQEAIFFHNGEALDTFGPGRHTLETSNIPLISKTYSLPAEGASPFHAEVYFINKTVQMGIKWGTDTRVRFLDPVTNLPFEIGAYGELGLQVADGRKLLTKLVGTASGLLHKDVLEAATSSDKGNTYQTLRGIFKAPLMTVVKSNLSSAIRENAINIFEIDAYMQDLSDALCEKLRPEFEEFGLTVSNFYIIGISLPEDDPNFKKLKELNSREYLGVKEQKVQTDIRKAEIEREILDSEAEAKKKVIGGHAEAEVQKTIGLAEAEVMHAQGYTKETVINAEVGKEYARAIGNMGSHGGGSGSSIATDVIGIAAGVKIAGGLIDNLGNVIDSAAPKNKSDDERKTAHDSDKWDCECGKKNNTGNFCTACGKERPQVWECSCGEKGNTGNFCQRCGRKKPQLWDCKCGKKNNSGNFCSECGAKKPDDAESGK